MLIALVIICSTYVFAKLIGFVFKLAWGIGKALFTFLFCTLDRTFPIRS